MTSHQHKSANLIEVLLSLGANFGNKIENLENAYESLISSGMLENAVMSSFYETEPVGILEQDWFMNVAIRGETSCLPMELLQLCKSIEYAIGRQKRARWHERELDIDIILYGNMVLEDEHLTIPHPRMYKRRFVLVPACEVAGDMIHPIKKISLYKMLELCPDSSEVRLF